MVNCQNSLRSWPGHGGKHFSEAVSRDETSTGPPPLRMRMIRVIRTLITTILMVIMIVILAISISILHGRYEATPWEFQ